MFRWLQIISLHVRTSLLSLALLGAELIALRIALSATLKNLHIGIVEVLDIGMANFLCRAFPNMRRIDILHAQQTLTFETLGDLHLRFTLEYTRFPYSLVRLVIPEALDQMQQYDLAQSFLALPRCCCQPC